jgi:hypothetical protein
MSNEATTLAVGNGKHDEKPNHVNLTVVVNTVDTIVEANVNWKLRQVAERALKQTGTTGRSLNEFVLKDANGNPLEYERTVESYGLPSGAVLFLSLEAGANG